MENFADRLNRKISEKGTPCIVGLDPRIESIPRFISSATASDHQQLDEVVYETIVSFHTRIIGLVAPLIPAVKLQAAFYEQYGLPGVRALDTTIRIAKRHGLLVIVDAKRNDIAPTAEAYATAYLGEASILGRKSSAFDADCITVSPYLGIDSLEPFVTSCARFGKGIFILVKTSNPGSRDFQDLVLADRNQAMYLAVAEAIAPLAARLVGSSGYSSIGAVVGAPYPREAALIRQLLPTSIFLVPGYGIQGGTAAMLAANFNGDGKGAVVSASRSLTYNFDPKLVASDELDELVVSRTKAMINHVAQVVT